ncbi:MAG: hypothetical protein Q8922_15905, partial [Bacteroidota bacterium]|nr:hypothetical protein [Bacteroidota bacterium]
MIRLLALSLVIYGLQPGSASAQQPPLIWQNDTVFRSVVGRVIQTGVGFKNASNTRELQIKDMYFEHQADSVFIVDEHYSTKPFTLPANSVSGASIRFKSPAYATTVHDNLIALCAYTDDPSNVMTLKRAYVGTTTTDSSSDSNRACVYGHDCNSMFPINPGDTSYGLLCYELEYLPRDTVYITSIEFVGRDAASFHLVNPTFPKSGTMFQTPVGRISQPYVFSPVRLTGPKRYIATAIAKMYSSDGILCHESDIDVMGYLATAGQDTSVLDLFRSDSLPVHFSKDSTTRWHQVLFINNSPSTIKIDSAYMGSGDCFEIDESYPPYGTQIH